MLPEALRERLAGRRVLATDLDGTLLRPDLTVGDLTRRAIADAAEAGVRVVFVTGRPPRWMHAVAEETGHAGVAVCANGAVLLDLADEHVLARHRIEAGDAHFVLAGLRERFGASVRFAAERAAVAPMGAPTPFGAGSAAEFAREIGLPPRVPEGDTSPAMTWQELAALPDLVKLLALLDVPPERARSYGADEFLAEAEVLAAGRLEVTHSSDHVLLEFGPRGITKATGLAELTADWGLTPADVVAVGDMPNDVPMLSWAGLGLAVAGAHPAAVGSADAVIPGPAEHGVGQVLQAILSQ